MKKGEVFFYFDCTSGRVSTQLKQRPGVFSVKVNCEFTFPEIKGTIDLGFLKMKRANFDLKFARNYFKSFGLSEVLKKIETKSWCTFRKS